MEEAASQLNVYVDELRSLYASVTPSTEESSRLVFKILDCLIETLRLFPTDDDSIGSFREDDRNNTKYYKQIWDAFNMIILIPSASHEKIIQVTLSTLSSLKSTIARDLLVNMIIRTISSLPSSSQDQKESLNHRSILEKRVIHELKSFSMLDAQREFLPSVFHILSSLQLYAWSSICEVLGYLISIIQNMSIQDWIPFITIIGRFLRLCADFQKKITDCMEISETVEQTLSAIRKAWSLIENGHLLYTGSETMKKHLTPEAKRTYPLICESITSLIIDSDLVADGYMCILENSFLRTRVFYDITPWSILDIAAMITLYSQRGKQFTRIKRFIQSLYLRRRLPFRYLKIFATLLRRPTKCAKVCVVDDRTNITNMFGCTNIKNQAFRHHISSSFLELIVYLMLLPAKIITICERRNVHATYYSRDMHRLVTKVFLCYDQKQQQDLVNALILISSPVALDNILSNVSDDEDGTNSIENQPVFERSNSFYSNMSSSPFGIWSTFFTDSRVNIVPDEDQLYMSSLFVIAQTVCSILSALIIYPTLGDSTKRLLTNRLLLESMLSSTRSYASIGHHNYLLIESYILLLADILCEDNNSVFSDLASSLMKNFRSLAYSAHVFNMSEFYAGNTSSRIVGLILANTIVHHSEMSNEAKNESIKWVLRLADHCVECIYLHLKPLYWVIVFMSSFCVDTINHTNQSLPRRPKYHFTGGYTKYEAFRQLKSLMTHLDLVRKISDYSSHDRTANLRFIDIPTIFTNNLSFEYENRMVLCIFSLSNTFYSQYSNKKLLLEDLSWWLRCIHVLTYAYIKVGRELSSQWAPDSWALAALESPYPHNSSDQPRHDCNSKDMTNDYYDRSATSVCFSVLSIGTYIAILENLHEHMEKIAASGPKHRIEYQHLLVLIEFQLIKIYEVDSSCETDLQVLSRLYDDFDDPPLRTNRKSEERESIKTLSNIYFDTYFGDIILSDELLWKYLLLMSYNTYMTHDHVDEPDRFAARWNLCMERSITLRTSITRHIIQRIEFSRVSVTIKKSPENIDESDLSKRINCLAQTINEYLPILPQLRQEDVYGKVSTETSPLSCVHRLIRAAAELLIVIYMNEERRRLLPFEDLFNRMLALASLCDDSSCSSVILDLASVIGKITNDANKDELEYALWDDLVSFLALPVNDSSDVNLSCIPHSFRAAVNHHLSSRIDLSNTSLKTIQELRKLSTKQLIHCDDFALLRHKLLLYWGSMDGTGEKLYENLAILVKQINSTNTIADHVSCPMMNAKYLAPKIIILFYELLMQMSLSSFALSEPMLDSFDAKEKGKESYPYQHIENYLQLLSLLISFFVECCHYKDARYRIFTVKVCRQMIQLCVEKVDLCLNWRRRLSSPLIIIGRRSNQSSHVALGHLGRLLQTIMTCCVSKIDFMLSSLRRFVSENQDPKDMKSITAFLKKLDKLSVDLQRLRDHVQCVCMEHNFFPSSLEVVTAPIRQVVIKRAIRRKVTRKKRRVSVTDEVRDYQNRKTESPIMSSGSSFAGSTSSERSTPGIFNKEDTQASESESNDSFGVIGRWGRDDTE